MKAVPKETAFSLYTEIVSEPTLTGKRFLSALSVECKKLDTFVNSVFIDNLHIVILRLTHLNTVKSGQTAKHLDIMISSAAEMNRAAVFF